MASSPPTRARENLLRLASDLLRRSWLTVGADHYLDDYRRSQWLPAPSLRELQLAALRRLAWHCFLNVPFHERHIGAALAPSQIERLDDVARLPLTPAAERRLHPDTFVARGTQEGAPRFSGGPRRHTAGTRGAPQPVRLDRDALAHQTAVRLRVEEWAGAPPARVVAAWGRETYRQPRPLAGAELSALGIALSQARGAVLSAPGDTLPSLLVLLEGQRRARLRAVVARGPDPEGGGAAIAGRLGAALHRVYGAAETGVIAATCERGGMHVQADHLLVEIVDGGGAPVPVGAVGEIVVTDLHNYVAPYLRHPLEDRGRLLASPCACGRALPLLDLAAPA